MAKSKKSPEELKEVVQAAKEKVSEAKKALTTYLKKNKLKRNEDHSGTKHEKKINTLNGKIEKAQTALEKAQEKIKASKGTTSRKTKYDYPEDVDTPAKRKKYRQEMRAAASGKGKKTKKTKKSEKGSTKTKKSSKKTSSKKSKKGSKKSRKDD